MTGYGVEVGGMTLDHVLFQRLIGIEALATLRADKFLLFVLFHDLQKLWIIPLVRMEAEQMAPNCDW